MSQQPIEGQDTGQVEVTQGQEETSGTSNINPAWNDLLGVLPSSLHSLVTPHLQKWDQNYQQDIGKVHSQYEPYKPFIEQNIPPEQVQYGLQLLDMIENNPQQIFDSLKEYLQIEDDPQQQVTDQEVEQGQQPTSIDVSTIPEFQQMTQMVNTMAELLVQQNSQQTQEQEDQALEQEFAAAKEQFGDFDEEWVMAKMLAAYERGQELPLNDVVQEYKNFEKSILANANRPGPKVLGVGGGAPNTNVNPSQLDEKGRKALIADMLRAQAQQAG